MAEVGGAVSPGAAAALVAPMVLAQRALADGEGTATYNMRYIPVENLGSFQKADQRNEFRTRAEQTIMQVGGGGGV